MLRPATPLTVLLLVAFALLLLSVLSVPVTKAIAMGSFKDTSFGVLGFCKDGGTCSPIGIGYDTEQLLDHENQAFDLPVNVRDTISVILVVHPVATLLALIMFFMAAASHLHGPGHSARYLLILFILILVTFLVCVLAFLVDVLLFVPNLALGSYLVLAATIILGLSGIASCAMRRAVVSRMAHKRRINDNAEMSGEYYIRGAQSKPSTAATNQPMLSIVSGGKGDNLPQFVSFEYQKQGDSFSDDRVPLTQRSPPTTSPTAAPYGMANQAQPTMRRAPPPRDPYALASNVAPGPYDSRRERGNMAAGGVYRGQGSIRDDRAGSIHSRGGYGTSPRDVYGNGGAQGLPYNDVGQYDRRPSADVTFYGLQTTQSWYAESAAPPPLRNNYEAYSPEVGLPRAESPPSFLGNEPSAGGGRPVEIGTEASDLFDQYGPIQDSDVAGLVGLQQDRPRARHETMMTEGSRYSSDEPYLPPRAAWNQASGTKAPLGSSANPSSRQGADALGRRSRSGSGPQDANYYDGLYSMYGGLDQSDSQPPPPANPGYGAGLATTGRARSPSESERSHFTSISQRGVNPRRQGPQYQDAPPRRLAQQQKQRRQDLLLDKPDFQPPGGRSKGGTRRAGAGMAPGGAYPATNL